jgi:regulatory protein
VTEASADIYACALTLLARREHSRQELQQKLIARYPDQQILIDQQLDRLEHETYQSDERFVEAYVRTRQTRGIGARRLRQELRTRGIDNCLIARALAASADAEDVLQRILQVWQKKFAQVPADAKEKHRQLRFLLYRGFHQQDVERLFLHLKEHFDSQELPW